MTESFCWALINTETTGIHITRDRLMKISVLIINEFGIQATWSSFINPELTLSSDLVLLTGFRNRHLQTAPVFADIAEDLRFLLKDKVVVAHNARFHYGFLKNAFKKVGISFNPPLLCTIKLFKYFYPHLTDYHLQILASHFKQPLIEKAELLYLLIQQCMQEFPVKKVLSYAQTLCQESVIPAHLETDVANIPNCPGVYLFYGDDLAMPIYIGKSINLRQRILSHFQADHTSRKEFQMAQQVKHIEVRTTGGELGALLYESRLIKAMLPLYNRRLRRKRRQLHFQLHTQNDYLTLSIINSDCGHSADNTFGSFSSMNAAKKTLEKLCKEFQLCRKLTDLEKTARACFAYQIKRCLGACVQEEEATSYNSRVQAALASFIQKSWPFPGAIAVYEYNEILNISEYLIINQWQFLGSVKSLEELSAFEIQKTPLTGDRDEYLLLTGYLAKLSADDVILLG